MLAVCLMSVAFTGCSTQYVSVKSSRRTDASDVPAFGDRLIVFNPPNKPLKKKEAAPYDTDPLADPYRLVLSNQVYATDSYVLLAHWCHAFAAEGVPFHFAVLDRRARSYPYTLKNVPSLIVALCSALTVPIPFFDRFRCQQQTYFSCDQGQSFCRLGPEKSRPPYYDAHGESYITMLTPLALCVPKYRRYRYAENGIVNNGIRLHRSQRCVRVAHEACKEDLMFAAVADLHAELNGKAPLPAPSDEAFDELVRQTFGQSYDASKSYLLVVDTTAKPLYKAEVHEAGSILSHSSGFKTTLHPGHLCVLYYQDALLPQSGRQACDLGDMRALAPVLSAWRIESGSHPWMPGKRR